MTFVLRFIKTFTVLYDSFILQMLAI